MKRLLLLALLGNFCAVSAATFTVTVTNDSGAGSLRQAILDANANGGADTIVFAIANATLVITPASALPEITDPVTLDATTQPGFATTPIVQLDGISAGDSLVNGLKISSGNSVVRGLVIHRFSGNGIELATKGTNLVEGCIIGLDAGGTVDLGNREGINILNSPNNVIGGTNAASRNVISGNADGVIIDGTNSRNNVVIGNYIGLRSAGTLEIGNSFSGVTIVNASDNTIGGLAPGSGNVISGNGTAGGSGVRILHSDFPSTNNRVLGNIIGLDAAGNLDRGNGRLGVQINSSNNIVGGASPEARNIISGNNQGGIRIEGSAARGNKILGNFIGTDITGTLNRRNSLDGIYLNSHSSTVGGTNAGEGNLIMFNDGSGVAVISGTNNLIRGNSISSNAGAGIDLGNNGVTENDSGDPDAGPNHLLNFPVLTNAVVNSANVILQGTYNGVANTDLHLDFYVNTSCDSFGNGEGQTWVATTNVTTDGSGNASFSASLPTSVRDRFITATATDLAGNSSEFSACLQVTIITPPLTFTVTTTADSGPGSLRQALLDVDLAANVGNDTIVFDIPGGGVKTISPLTPLPTPFDPVTIDGYTQPGANTNSLQTGNDATLLIRLDGAQLASGEHGLNFIAASNVVKGLIVTRFPGHGMIFSEGGGNRIEGNWIGLDSTGAAAGNGLSGVSISGSGNTVGGTSPGLRNVIAANGDDGVTVFSPGGSNLIRGNFIGTGVQGTNALGNANNGVRIVQSGNNTVGGTVAGVTNVLSGNLGYGVEISGLTATNNRVERNMIGTDLTTELQLGNQMGGVHVTGGARSTLIGGTTSSSRNIIAYNTGNGVWVDSGNRNAIMSNLIVENTLKPIAITGGANNGVQPPDLTSVAQGSTIFTGSATILQSGSWRIQYFAQPMVMPSSPATSKTTHLMSDLATSVLPGTMSVNRTFTANYPEGTWFYATQTIDNNTSEASPPITFANSSDGTAQTAANFDFAGVNGDPISTFTGELFNLYPPDLNLGGPLPLFFQRYYASKLKTDGRITGRLGDNWLHNFEMSLTNKTATIEIVNQTGRAITFTNNAGSFTLVGQTNVPFQLQTNGSNFIFSDPRSKMIYTFNATGRLTKIEDGLGNAHTLVYAGDNLASVNDSLGRALSFQYSAGGFLTNVSDGVRSIGFTQTGNNLTSVRDPMGFVSSYTYDLTNAVVGLMRETTQPKGNSIYSQIFDNSGRVVSQTDSVGNTFLLSYAGNVTTLTDPLGNIRQDTHNSAGQQIAFKDEANETLLMTYNAAGQRQTITDRLGNATHLGYHAASGYVSSLTNADGSVTTFDFTNRVVAGATFFDLTRITYADGATEIFTHDANGNILTRTDRSGNVFTFTYNARGQLLTMQNPAGGVLALTYHANGTLASRDDSDTGVTTFAYDSFSRVTNVVHPDGTTIKAAYDANDRLTSITDERNNTFNFAYDDNGNLISVTDPFSQTAQFAYDARDRLRQTMDRAGKTSAFSYDPLDQVSSVTNRNGHVTQFNYDTRRRLSSVTDAGNQVWNFGYDKEALLTSASNPLNQTNRIRRDALGYQVGYTNALGQSAGLLRDSLRRVTATVDGLSRTNGFKYDSRGMLTNTLTPVIGSAHYERNNLGLLSRIIGLNGEQWKFAYTAMGRRQSVVDPLNRTNYFTYDNRGRSAVTTFADGTTRSNSYDAAGNVTRRFYSAGPDLHYTYDALNRVVSADNLALAYDAESRITNTTSSGVQFRAAYDAGGRLTNVTCNGGLFSVTYNYDSRNRLISVSDSLSGTILNFIYDNAGRLTGVTRPNGVNGTYTYDDAGRLTRIQEGTVLDLQYGLDAAAQVTNLNYTMPLEPTDLLGGSISNWTYDAAHQINNAGYSYDARGRQTAAPGRTQQYDGASRLTQINSATLGYNGFHDIITRTEGGVTTRYFYNHALGMKPIAAEKNESNGQFRYYIWSPGGRLLYMIDHGNVVRHFHFDRVGSTLALTEAGGAVTDSYAYTPYGELLGRTGTNPQPFLYVGRYGVRSEPGAKLYHMRARYYDPVTARFLTRDPVWPVLTNPKSLDPYQYVQGNPLSYIDPLGLQSIPNYDGDFVLRRSQTYGLGGLQEQLDLALTSTGEDDPIDPVRVAELRQQIEEEKKRGPLVPKFNGPLFRTGAKPRSEKVQFFINRVSTTQSVMHGLGVDVAEEIEADSPSLTPGYGMNRVSTTRSVMHGIGHDLSRDLRSEVMEWILYPTLKYLELLENPRFWSPSDRGGGNQSLDPGEPEPEESILDEIDEVFVPA